MTLFFFILFCCAQLAADTRSLVILHTNDLHGHIKEEQGYGGAAKIAGLIKALRQNRKDLLVVDAGDAVSGTPVSTLFRGTPVFEVMSEMGYDLGNLGNHEFDYGYEQIKAFRKAANFPLLSANALSPAGKLLADKASDIIRINRINIGVIGVITEATPDIIIPAGNKNIQITSAAAAIEQLLPGLRARADLIIVLSHLGFEADVQLAQKIRDIDLIVGGHSHTSLWPARKVNQTWLVQANQYGTHLGKVEMTVDTRANNINSFHATLIPAGNLPQADNEVRQLVSEWEEKVKKQVDFKIATSPKIISGDELRQFIESVMAEAANAEFGYYNQGGIRDSIPKGKVTARHIWNIEPFSNTLVTMRLKGRRLKQLLQRETEDRPDLRKLDDEQEYHVATNNFVASHATRAFGDEILVEDKDLVIRNVLIDHIRRHGLFRDERNGTVLRQEGS